jgi:hypothetical protein
LISLGCDILRPGGRLVFFYHTDEKLGTKTGDCSELIDAVIATGCFKVIDIAACEFLRARTRHMITL